MSARAIAPMRRETGTDAETAYSDAMWAFENADEETPELIRALYAASSDYVHELRERLEERDEVLHEVHNEAHDVMEMLGLQPHEYDGDTAYDTVRSIYGVLDVLGNPLELDRIVSRFHNDHHTRPEGMCWEGVCAYVNGLENIAYMKRGA